MAPVYKVIIMADINSFNGNQIHMFLKKNKSGSVNTAVGEK